MKKLLEMKLIDSLCLYEGLIKASAENIEFSGRIQDPDGVTLGWVPLEPNSPDVEKLQFTVSRYAMDGNGSHVGEETFTAYLRVLSKSDWELHEGSPYNLSPTATVLHIYDIDIVPAMTDMEISLAYPQEEDEDDVYDGYCPPDDDFAYHECQYILDVAVEWAPEPDFEPTTRTWSIGPWSYKVGE